MNPYDPDPLTVEPDEPRSGAVLLWIGVALLIAGAIVAAVLLWAWLR